MTTAAGVAVRPKKCRSDQRRTVLIEIPPRVAESGTFDKLFHRRLQATVALDLRDGHDLLDLTFTRRPRDLALVIELVAGLLVNS
jgi:hypothetical protein